MKTKQYEVYATAFHGGRLISRHSTEALAERAVRKYRMSDCTCGCAGIVDCQAGERPGTQAQQDAWSNPYAVGAV